MTDFTQRIRPAPDPDGIHYMLSEDAHYDFQILTGALAGLANLCLVPLDADGPDFSVGDAEPLFRICAAFSHGILAECVLRRPPLRSV